ncbi:MAG TPA: acyl-CoA thioesterase [Longimicrobiales bacterium]|nr:acyl-CoA thioesterase [Longimicrobiales bacterium]
MQVPDDGWYRFPVPVRFRDLDPMGHAHHTLPLIYLEEARAAFWRELKGSAALDAIDYVMAEVTLRFHARILFPSTVEVLLGVSDVGNRSFSMIFEIRDPSGALLSGGSAVQVCYDYDRGASRPLADGDRAVLQSWQAARPDPELSGVRRQAVAGRRPASEKHGDGG